MSDLALGSCRQLPYAEVDRLFFDAPNGATTAKAKAICAGCPVRQPCYDVATTERIPHGTFGGESARERRARLGIRKFEYAA